MRGVTQGDDTVAVNWSSLHVELGSKSRPDWLAAIHHVFSFEHMANVVRAAHGGAGDGSGVLHPRPEDPGGRLLDRDGVGGRPPIVS